MGGARAPLRPWGGSLSCPGREIVLPTPRVGAFMHIHRRLSFVSGVTVALAAAFALTPSSARAELDDAPTFAIDPTAPTEIAGELLVHLTDDADPAAVARDLGLA